MHAPQGYASGAGSYPSAPPGAGVGAAAGVAGYPRAGQPASQAAAVWAGGQLVSASPQYVQPQAAQLPRNLSTEGWPAGGAPGVPRPSAMQHAAYQQTGPLGRVPSGQGLHAPMLGPAAPAYHAPGPTSQGPFTFFGPGQPAAASSQMFHFEAAAAASEERPALSPPQAPAGQRERAPAAPAEAAAHGEEAPAAPPPRPPPQRQLASREPAAPAQQRGPQSDAQPAAPPQPQRQPPQAAGGGGAGQARPEQAAAASAPPREPPTPPAAAPAPQGADRAARRSELIRQSFAFVDRLRTGHINQNQNQMGLQMVFQQLDAPLPKDEWFARVFKNFSANEKGLIDYKSFKEIVVQWDEHHLKKRQAATPPARADAAAAAGTAAVTAQKQQASSDPASAAPSGAPCSGDSASDRVATASSDRDAAATTPPSRSPGGGGSAPTRPSSAAESGTAGAAASRPSAAEGGLAGATVSRSSSSARAAAAELKSEVMFPTYHGQLAIFDDYEFFGDVGAGTFGKVMVVRHKQTKQMRACKVVAVSNPLQRELADTEISLLKSLNHPNIMKMHEVYFENGGGGRSVTNGNIYLVTELCEGGDLFSRILHHYGRLKQPMTESHVAFMMTQILSATKYCHEKGIVHRDIKPENILFVDRSSSSPVKIIDFGLANFTAKIREQAKEVDLPRSGRLGQLARLLPAVNGKHVIPLQERKTVMQKAGTPHYMAPEMIEGEYDHLADMFSIGIILCQLFTGWHPFYQPGDDEVSVRVKISDPEPVRFPADIWEFVSQQAQDLCRKLLDKNPRTRLSAAQALRHSWFEDGKPSAFGNKEVLSVSIFDGLMKYQAYNKLKRAVLQLLTRELSEFQIQELRNKFMGLDTQGDGLLSPEELIEGMRNIGYQMSDSDLSQIVAALDGTGSQRIGYKEFISALIERRVKFDRQQLWECFKKFDVQSTGKITYQDVKRAMSGSISESEWQEIAALPGRPVQQAELTFDEFVAIMEQQDG